MKAVIIFFGAGVSMPLGMLTGSDIKEQFENLISQNAISRKKCKLEILI